MTEEQLAKEQLMERLYGLLELQREMLIKFGESRYNIFIFGSYVTTSYREEKSDIDIAVYTEDFDLYKKLAVDLEEFFDGKGIKSDIFYIDLTMAAPFYCAALQAKVQFTDYFPPELKAFYQKCRSRLDETKTRMAV